MKEPPKRWRRGPPKPDPILVVVEPTPVSISSPVTVPPPRVEQSKSMILATVVMALTSLVMLGVTMHMARTSLRQWEALREQINQTNDVLEQMRLEQRAWVGVQNPRFADPEIGKPLQWSMYLSNSGKTPALVERIEWNTARRPKDIAFDPSTVRLIGTVDLQQSLAPGPLPTRVPFTSTNNVINQALLDFIKDANATDRIYIFGVVHYEDVAGTKRETEFAFVNESGSYELRLHHKHNRMR